MCGASKRGWTTWLAAGIDKRVEAFIPIVMPILNITPNLDSAFRSLGGWSWTFGDYVSPNILIRKAWANVSPNSSLLEI